MVQLKTLILAVPLSLIAIALASANGWPLLAY